MNGSRRGKKKKKRDYFTPASTGIGAHRQQNTELLTRGQQQLAKTDSQAAEIFFLNDKTRMRDTTLGKVNLKLGGK